MVSWRRYSVAVTITSNVDIANISRTLLIVDCRLEDSAETYFILLANQATSIACVQHDGREAVRRAGPSAPLSRQSWKPQAHSSARIRHTYQYQLSQTDPRDASLTCILLYTTVVDAQCDKVVKVIGRVVSQKSTVASTVSLIRPTTVASFVTVCLCLGRCKLTPRCNDRRVATKMF